MDAEWVRAARLAAGLTVRAASGACGVGMTAWNNWERGVSAAPPLAVLALALAQTPAAELVRAAFHGALSQMERAREGLPELWARGRRDVLGVCPEPLEIGVDWAPAAGVAPLSERLPRLSLALVDGEVQLAAPELWVAGWFTPADVWGAGPKAVNATYRLKRAGVELVEGAVWYSHDDARFLALGVNALEWAARRGVTHNQALALLELAAHDPGALPGVEARRFEKEWRVIEL